MFKYSIIKMFRSIGGLFWMFIFPLVLMTAMHFAFDSIYDYQNSIDPMKTILITEGEGVYQQGFGDLIDSLSEEDAEDQLFILEEADSLEDAKAKLAGEEAEIIFVVSDGDVEVYLQENHSITSAAVAGSIADTYKQRYQLIADAWEQDPAFAMELVNNAVENVTYTVSEEDAFGAEPNPYNWYFLSTLVMGILFMAMMGINMVGDLRADVSAVAMRYSVSPARKGQMVVTAFAARVIPGLVIVAIQLMVMKYVFGIYLGNDYLKLALFVVSAVMFAISFGVICGLCFKGDVHQRGNKATSLIMISVFLSGEMISQLPGLFEKYFPIFNKINPATVLNMALFKLTIGNSAEGFFMNIAEIIGLTVVFLAIGIAVLRREKYASV